MDEREIERITGLVLRALREEGPGGAESGPGPDSGPGSGGVDGIVDIGSPEFKKRLGVTAPHNPKALADLQAATGARMALGKKGTRPPCAAYLRFLADHARSKGTVFKEVPGEWLEKNNLPSFETMARDKDTYLTRPDLGRRIAPETLAEIKKLQPDQAEVQVVLSDGLSSDAMLSNYEEILPVLMRGFEAMNISAGRPFFLRFGRVKAEDVIGEALGSKAVVLLIGERPGLGQSESMSCYAVYNPTADTVESDRTVISNIHHGGLPPVEAGAVIVELVADMLKHRASGIELNRKMGKTNA